MNDGRRVRKGEGRALQKGQRRQRLVIGGIAVEVRFIGIGGEELGTLRRGGAKLPPEWASIAAGAGCRGVAWVRARPAPDVVLGLLVSLLRGWRVW